MNNKFDILVTGACGMVGSHLVETLDRDPTKKVIGTHYNPTVNLAEIQCRIPLVECDVRYPTVLNSLIVNGLPSKIFHLAAQSYPTVSWVRPAETMDTNCVGTVNLMEAIKQARILHPDYDPIVVVACSSAQYGAAIKEKPVDEETAFLPLHPYGVSKVGQDLLSYQYFMCDKIKTIRARIFNSTGPRKKNDVISDFSQRLVQIERGKESKLKVGNTKTKRTILDVSDLVDALILLSDHGQAGEAYNICGDTVYMIEEIINMMSEITGKSIDCEVEPSLLRKTDEPIILGDNSKMKKLTQWKQKVPLRETITKVIEYYRNK